MGVVHVGTVEGRLIPPLHISFQECSTPDLTDYTRVLTQNSMPEILLSRLSDPHRPITFPRTPSHEVMNHDLLTAGVP